MNIMEKYFAFQVASWDRSKVYRFLVISVIVMASASISISIWNSHYTIFGVLNILLLIDAALSAAFGYSSAETFEEWWTQKS